MQHRTLKLRTKIVAFDPTDKEVGVYLPDDFSFPSRVDGEFESSAMPLLNWNDIEHRLRDLYPTPVQGTTAAELVARGHDEF